MGGEPYIAFLLMTVPEGPCKVCPSQVGIVLHMAGGRLVRVHIALHLIYSSEGITFRLVLK